MSPIFDTIPIIQNRSGIRLAFLTIAGVSTKHASTDTDNGKLYSTIVDNGGGGYTVSLYSDFALLGGSLKMQGGPASLGQLIDLLPQNASGMTGRARLDGNGTISNPQIAIVSMATDADVFRNARRAEAMPGFDATYGLASFHAAAMRQILTSDLPSVMPQAYRNQRLAAFVPLSPGAELPDLTVIESVESLRDAQAMLVKAMSAREADHLEEFADMADRAMRDLRQALADIKDANAPEEIEQDQQTGGITIGSFTRG
jgi:hypothetical protein